MTNRGDASREITRRRGTARMTPRTYRWAETLAVMGRC